MERQIALFDCVNLAAAGLLIRGKPVTDDYQVHRVGCRDLNDLIRISRRQPDVFDSLDEMRDDFNADMGPGGTAGFEEGGGWDFDDSVNVKPCVKKGS